MIRAIRQSVVVQPGGRIEVTAPELKAGTQAEVIVLEQGPARADEGPLVPLASLVGSCKGMFATPEEADEFLQRERDAWDL